MTHVVKAAFAAMLIMIVPTARAVDVKAGNWDLSFSGNVNAFATYNLCAEAPAAGSAREIRGVPLACAAASAPHQFSIESGLLPSAFVFTAKTTVAGLDTSATIGFYPGLHVTDTRTGVGAGHSTGTAQITADVRQNFLTVGNKAWGTVKLGKDIGLFGSDAILSDMLLLGVGAGAHQGLNHNVTIGHIGSGYIYADWIPQITYYTPSFNGLQVTLSVVEAFGNSGFSTQIPGQSVPALNNNQPGFQGRVSYDMTGPVTARAWVGGMYQHAKAVADTHAGLDSIGLEAGAKASSNGISALAYGYWGNGIGTTLLGLAGTNGVLSDNGDLIRTRKSYGFFGQVTAEIPGTKLKPGISYGNSFLKEARFEDDPNLLRSNSMFTGALFYALTPNLTLTAEYDHLWSRNQANWVLQSNTVALGGIIFF